MSTRRSTLLLGLWAALTLAGCESESRWDAAQEASEKDPKAVSEAALPGSTFNKYFPKQEGGIDIIYKQEKTGFAQASLEREDVAIAMLSISDTRNNPAAREKFKATDQRVGEYPAVVQGNTTSLLVADRFQVQVRSEGDALPPEDRAAWLQRFDLAGLAKAF